MGTPETAVVPLQALLKAGHDIVVVVSGADKRRGRGAALAPSPVKAAALEAGLEVTHDVDDVVGRGAELGVVVAFGQIIRPHVLAELAMVNLHFSLLPRWRGAAPVERAILAGDVRTGVCLMAVEEGLDTGGVYARREVEIGSDQTAEELRAELTRIGAELLLDRLSGGLGNPVPQEGEPTYAAKIEPDELRLDWTRPAVELHRLVRIGGAWTSFRSRRLRLVRSRLLPDAGRGLAPGEVDAASLRVGTGEGAVELVEVQPEGRAVQPAASWRNGARLLAGDGFE